MVTILSGEDVAPVLDLPSLLPVVEDAFLKALAQFSETRRRERVIETFSMKAARRGNCVHQRHNPARRSFG
jgi:hypothetical protein